MKTKVSLIIIGLLFAFLQGSSQRVTYSDPDRDDPRVLNFEIIGKVNGKLLIYKNYRELHFIAVYDPEMRMLEKNRLEITNARVLNTEFLVYADYAYMIYQFQKRSAIFCMAVKIDGSGKQVGQPIEMDSTENINYSANNKIYSVINSEDKQKIMLFKINSKNDKMHILTTSLFNHDLQLLRKSKLNINMPARNDFLSEFTLDNDGDMVCVRASGTATYDNINKVSLITKPALKDTFSVNDLKLNGIFLDDIRIKADNINKHYLVTSFVSKMRRGNIDGIYYTLWDKIQNREILNATTTFSEELRSDAKGGDGNTKTAFNDFFLKNIILRKDGGFIIAAESAYTSTRGNPMNRWDYMYGSPYGAADYYTSRGAMGYYPWGGYNGLNNANSLTRFFTENVAVISFEPNGKMEWSNIIRKSQFDDNTDNFIGFGLVNTGDQLHFIFNIQEKRNMILSDQSISPGGQVDRTPTFKNLDKGYDFMPRHAKQIGSRQAIIPCQYRGFTCFAKIEFQ